MRRDVEAARVVRPAELLARPRQLGGRIVQAAHPAREGRRAIVLRSFALSHVDHPSEATGRRPRLTSPASAGPQRAAFFTIAVSFFSTAGVQPVKANEVTHISPASSLAASSKPTVA